MVKRQNATGSLSTARSSLCPQMIQLWTISDHLRLLSRSVQNQAGLCAISLTLSITQRDAFCRCNLLPTESRRYGTTGLEVAVG